MSLLLEASSNSEPPVDGMPAFGFRRTSGLTIASIIATTTCRTIASATTHAYAPDRCSPGPTCALLGRRATSGLSRSKESARHGRLLWLTSPSPIGEREAETRIGPQVPRAGGLVKQNRSRYLSGVLGGSTARSSRLGDGVSD